MIAPLPFEPRRFQSAAAYYLAGRSPYAGRLIARTVERCRLGPADRLLDLGCGPGQLAVAFSPFVGSVVAIDPEPEMLRAATTAAAEAGVAIEFIQGSSYDIGAAARHVPPRHHRPRLPLDGPRRHAPPPRCHRRARRRRGPLPRHPSEAAENRWQGDYKALIDGYAAGDPMRELHKSPDWIPHEAVLLDSPFARLERIGVMERRRTPVDRLVDRALSMSSTSPQRIGPRADDLIRELRALLAGVAVDGMVTEIVESQALLAFRPDDL
jgi:SAM-dependent methyltransferase